MKLAIYLPDTTPYSMKFCAWNIVAILENKYAVECLYIKTISEFIATQADIYWDPRCGGGIAPTIQFRKIKKPLVLTVHGMALFTLPLDTFFFTIKEKIKGQLKRIKERTKWHIMQKHIAHVMTVSAYTKEELSTSVHFPKEKITAIWNGIDHTKFVPKRAATNEQPYFLTVISYQKKKNFERLIEAYQLLDENTRPKLIAIVKPYQPSDAVLKIKGVEIIHTAIEEQRLIQYYQEAMALVFVSLHEGFGLPIAEAMACGVPVITSNSTSCKEIAGDAALLVNPKDMNAIKDAMLQITNDHNLRAQLITKGKERAKVFNWEQTADAFYAILQQQL